jgi:hypothetical protein
MATPMPKFFCVENSGYYKIYMNSIYKASATLDREVSVIWPQDNIVARTMTIKLRNDQDKSTTYRKWNGKDYIMMSWSFTGSSIDMSLNDRHITISCPVIQVSDRTMLPFNTCSVKPSRETFQDEDDSSTYEKADIYERDPNSPEYITPIPQRRGITYFSSASSLAPVATPSVASLVPSNNRKGLPPHVAKLILADSISKNEDCPISCDTITMENGSVTSCGHVFCKSSLDDWFKIKNECPVCKQVCL